MRPPKAKDITTRKASEIQSAKEEYIVSIFRNKFYSSFFEKSKKYICVRIFQFLWMNSEL